MGTPLPVLARVGFFLTMLAMPALAPNRAAACATWTTVLCELQTIRRSAEGYHAARGDWPRDDGTLRWYEQIMLEPVTEGFLDGFEFDACGPLDRWGNNVIYEPPPPGSPIGVLPVIRSAGFNGLSELGHGDDLTAGGTVNPGSYGRPTKHACVAFSVLSAFAYAALISIWWAQRRRLHPSMLTLTGVWIGLSCMIGANLLWPDRSCSGRLWSPAREISELGGLIFGATIVASLLWCIVVSAREVAKEGRQLASIHEGLCTSCGYDLKGLPERRCPECGRESPPVTEACASENT